MEKIICPKCSSKNITYYIGNITGKYECKNCNYIGNLVIEKNTKNNLICLGIEGTSHTFGASILTEKGEILSDIRDMYKTEKGGIVPKEAAQHHRKISKEIINKAIKEAKIKEKDIDIIAWSKGPGLAPPLLATKEIATKISKRLKKPLIGCNHLQAHIELGKLLTKAKDPVSILVTGANTQIIFFENNTYHIGGECLSIGLGNALDKFGRALDLGFPSGPEIEQLAKKGNYIELPYVVKGMDVEFSGIITKAIDLYKKGAKKEDLCFSLQETLFAMLTEVSERALSNTQKKELLLIGGVAANKRLIEMLNIMCKERNAKFHVVPFKYSGDNSAMIAWTGILQYKSNKSYYNNLDIEKIDIKPNWRIDQVKIKYQTYNKSK